MTTSRFLEKNVAITGIGQSEVGRPSTRSAMQLTLDAALEAIADAGLNPKDIDGVCSWPGDNANGSSFSPVGPLRFEWGVPINPRAGEQPLAFEFTIGNSF